MFVLARSYILGPHGVCAAESTISSDHPYLLSFVAACTAHPKNRLAKCRGLVYDEQTGSLLAEPLAPP